MRLADAGESESPPSDSPSHSAPMKKARVTAQVRRRIECERRFAATPPRPRRTPFRRGRLFSADCVNCRRLRQSKPIASFTKIDDQFSVRTQLFKPPCIHAIAQQFGRVRDVAAQLREFGAFRFDARRSFAVVRQN